VAGLATAVARERNRPPRIACLGLAFKADVDDLRESPAVEVTRRLATERPDLAVLAVEPHVRTLPTALAALPNVTLTDTDAALAAADVVVLLVDHRPFRDLDRARLAGRAVVDTRGAWRDS
jgi:UDP-N-acetyl-D-mannosaminuronic acid dehydrogenase